MKLFVKGIKSTDNISEHIDNRVSVSLAKNEPLVLHITVVDSAGHPVAINDPATFIAAAVYRKGSSSRIGYGSSLNTSPARQKDGVVEITLTMNSNVEPGEYMWNITYQDETGSVYRLMDWSSFVLRK